MFKGLSLLLCHGNIHYKIEGLDPERTLTIDSDPKAKPDININISGYKVTCHLFDRVYMLFCPIAPWFAMNFIFLFRPLINRLVLNFIRGSLKLGGILIMPIYTHKILTKDDVEKLKENGGLKYSPKVGFRDDDPAQLDEIMLSLGFKYVPFSDEIPKPARITYKKTNGQIKSRESITNMRAYKMISMYDSEFKGYSMD